MTDSCIICQTEAIDLTDWFIKSYEVYGQTAVIECICPWCVKEVHQIQELVKTHDGSDYNARQIFDKIDLIVENMLK